MSIGWSIHMLIFIFYVLIPLTIRNQLGIHNKPIGLLNVNHYYDKLLEWVCDM